MDKYTEKVIKGYWNKRIHETRILESKDTRIQGLKDTRTQGYNWVQEYRITRK